MTDLEFIDVGSDATPSNPVKLALPPAADNTGEPAPPTGPEIPRSQPEPLFVNGVRLNSVDGRTYVASHVTPLSLTLTRADKGPRRDRQQRKFEKAERRRLRATRQVLLDNIDAAVAACARPQVDW